MLSREALSKPMHEVETEQMSQLTEVGRLLLQAHLRARGVGDAGPQACHPGGDGNASQVFRRGRVRERKQESVFGEVTVERLAYNLAGHQSLFPLDRELQLPERSFSYPVQRLVVKQAVLGPFDEATGTILEYTGAKVSKRSAEDILREAARDFDDFYAESGPAGSARSQAIEPIQACALDCKGVPMKKSELTPRPARRKKGEKANKKRMATVAAVYATEARERTPEEVTESLFRPLSGLPKKPETKPVRPTGKRVWASLTKGKDATIQEVRDEMHRRDPDRRKRWVALSDGELALQRRILKWMPGILLVLDLFHVLEKLWRAAYLFHPEGSQEAAEWVRARVLRILRGQVSDVVRTLRQSATKRGFTGTRRKIIDEVTGYLYRNRPYMRYHEYLAEGLPIASGAVEGACKNLVKDRMERSGMRWSIPGAEAMLKMRAIYLSGDFESYWAFHVAQDQCRLAAGAGRPLQAVAGK
jgi:hypothetical protein